MSAGKALVIGGLGIGGLILWSLWKEGQANVVANAPIDEEDPTTPDLPRDTWSGDTEALKKLLSTTQLQQDLSTPTQAGGLRNAPGSIELDTRFTPYGRLVGTLKAKDYNFAISEAPSNRFAFGALYRLRIEGEELLARFDGGGLYNPGMFTIVDRPMMTNWTTRSPSYRTGQYDENGVQMWTQYSHANPAYSREIKQRWINTVRSTVTHGDGSRDNITLANTLALSPDVWVIPIIHNCQHSPTYDSLPEWRTYDAELGACRAMSSEEQAHAEGVVASTAAAAVARTAEENRLRNAECMSFYGVPCRDWNDRLLTYYGRSDPPTADEMPGRIRRLLNSDTDITQPSDLMAGIAATRVANNGTPISPADLTALGSRIASAGVTEVDIDTLASRRARGMTMYQRLNPNTRWKCLRDLYSVAVWGLNPNGQRGDGRYVIMGMGGYYGFIAKWDPVGAT
jgi:hypothetical protein